MDGIQTFKGSWPWPWPWIRPYGIPSCITHRPLPTYQISLKSKKLFVDGRTDGRTFSASNIIRSIFGSRPKNDNNGGSGDDGGRPSLSGCRSNSVKHNECKWWNQTAVNDTFKWTPSNVRGTVAQCHHLTYPQVTQLRELPLVNSQNFQHYTITTSLHVRRHISTTVTYKVWSKLITLIGLSIYQYVSMIVVWRYATWYCYFLCNATAVFPVLSCLFH